MENGAVVLDEPLDLPDGTLVLVNVSSGSDAFAGMDAEERIELEAAIEEGCEDLEKGAHVDGLEFVRRLLAEP